MSSSPIKRTSALLLATAILAACSSLQNALQGEAPNPPGFVIGEGHDTKPSDGAKPSATTTEAETEPAHEAPKTAAADKPRPGQHVQQAMSYLSGNQLGLALTEIDQALLINPKDVQALNVAGLVYEKMGDTQSALKHLSNAVFAAPQDPYSRNNYGTLLCKLGQQREAIEQFEQIAQSPNYDSPDVAYTNAGLCARTIPDLDLAAKYFNEALQLNSQSATALYQVAKLSFENGHYTSAREDLQNYLRVAPNTPKTLLLRVQIEHALGNGPARQAYADQLAQLFPNAEETAMARTLIATGALPQTQAPNCNAQVAAAVSAVTRSLTTSPGTTTAKPSTHGPGAAAVEKPRAAIATTLTTPPQPAGSPMATVPVATKSVAVTPAAVITPAAPSQGRGEIHREDWLLKQDPDRYVIQLRSDRDEHALQDFIRRNRLNTEDAAYFQFRYKDDIWYSALVGNYSTLDEAQAAITRLSAALTDQTPWARRFGHIQELIREGRRTAVSKSTP